VAVRRVQVLDQPGDQHLQDRPETQLQRGEAKPKGCTEAPKGGSVNFALDALRAQLC